MKKILSIDDDPEVLNSLKMVLQSRGYELYTTTDPDEGLKVLKEDENISLAMLDIRMPKKNGFEIYNELRQFRNIPVLFITAYPRSFTAESDEITEMWKNEFADGTTDIIYKPFDLSTLFEKIEGLIGKADDEGENA